MNIIPTASHPSFCDPRCCSSRLDDDGDVHYEHRDGAPAMRPAAQPDAEITLRRTQLEECSRIPLIGETVGPVVGTLTITDTSLVTPNGDRVSVDVDLDPADRRMLAAQMVCLAEQVESARLAGRGT